MRPLVIDQLSIDLACYGSCFWHVDDTPWEFRIRRVAPCDITYDPFSGLKKVITYDQVSN